MNFRNTRLGDFIFATASNFTFDNLLLENLDIFSSSGAESFLTLFVVDSITQQNYFLTINNSIFANLSHGDTILSLFISVTTNYLTNVTISNLSMIKCDFLSTIMISLNKVSDIVILNLIVYLSNFLAALFISNSGSLLLNKAVFQNNNQYNNMNVYNCGPALSFQDVFIIWIEGLQVLYSRSDISTLGIILLMPNSLHLKVSSIVIMEDSIFMGNTAIFVETVIDGGCAIYIESDVSASMTLSNITFQDNQIIILPNAEEILGAAAIRSIGSQESISLTKCLFINQISTHMSSTIWFQGQSLIITGFLTHFFNNFLRLKVHWKQSLGFIGPVHWVGDCGFLWGNDDGEQHRLCG